MKAFFIYRDGKKFGNPTGYTTEKGARKSLVGCEDWYKLLMPFQLSNAKEELNPKMKATGVFKWSEYVNCWLLDRNLWSRKIWAPYVKEHYQIIEQEYNVEVSN